jgi:predicted dehydrogenase
VARRVGWGVLGTGALADRFIAPAIAEHDGSQLAAVLSRDINRADAFAIRHGADAAYDDYQALLEDPAVDLVYIATPNALHAQHALDAIAAGKHVLVEKPMALTVEDGYRIVETASAANRIVGVGFHLRHKVAMMAARDAVVTGRLGRVFLVELEVAGDKIFYPFHTWRSDLLLSGGGTVLNQGTHCIDLARYLTDEEFDTVVATADTAEREDVFAAVCTMTNGTIVTMTSHQLRRGTRPDLAVIGEQGWLHGQGGTSPMPGELFTLHNGDGEAVLPTSDQNAYYHEVDAMVSAIAAEDQPLACGDDGLAAIKVVEAIYRAIQTGCRVVVGAT